MPWTIRNRVPSDEQLDTYDRLVSAREAEIKRPGRKVNIMSDEEYDLRKKSEHLKRLWQLRYLMESKRRNKIVYEKSLHFFHEHFKPSEGPETLWLKAQAAVCKSIVKDFLFYSQLASRNKLEIPEHDPGEFPFELFSSFARQELMLDIDENDILNVTKAFYSMQPPSKMMSSQIKRDFDEVTEAIDFFQTLCNLPGWSDPETSVNLCKSVAMRIYSVDEANVGWLKGTRDEYKSKVLEEQKKGYVDDVLKALQGPAPSFATDVISLEPEQLTALRSFLDTEAKIRALYKLFSDSEWSKDPEGLAKEKEVLSSILNDASVQRLLFEAIMKTFLTKSKVVEVIASIRNEVFSSWKAAANEEEFYDRYSGAVRHYDKNIKEENEESAADAYKNYDVREWSSSPYFSRYYDAGYF